MEIALKQIEVQLPNRERRTLFRIQDLQIKSGSRVLIRGPSGSGKTTLLHLMAGLFLPAAGTVEVGKTKLNSLSDEERCQWRLENAGIVFQRLNLLDHLTATENVELGFSKASAGHSLQALEALKRMKLADRAKDVIGKMSVGEQQRIAIARVLAAQPELILADEPTSSLDEVNALSVIDSLLQGVPRATVVVVSHDERIIERFERVLNFEEIVS